MNMFRENALLRDISKPNTYLIRSMLLCQLFGSRYFSDSYFMYNYFSVNMLYIIIFTEVINSGVMKVFKEGAR